MRALVTGGAGFIGSYLIPELVSKGVEVVVFDKAEDTPRLDPVRDQITFVKGDLSSQADLYRAMIAHRVTEVFHLGAILAGPCEENPVLGFKVNFHSTQTLLDGSRAAGVRRFLMLSSISVFGKDAPEPVPDSAVKNPETIYGQTKLACEHLLLWYARKHGLDTRALRFAWVFGPGRTTGITAQYSSLILDAIAKNEPLTVRNPEERGDWLYVKDAVRAIIALWEAKDVRERIYNISGGVFSIREVVELARKLRPEATISLMDKGGVQSPYPVAYDDSVARKEIGWQPSYTIEDAVREHLQIVSEGKI
jgi:UDP-glucose 4-epimerase